MKGSMVITYRIRYWFGGKLHYTRTTYKSKRSAEKGLEEFRGKNPSRKSNIVKQTVVPI